MQTTQHVRASVYAPVDLPPVSLNLTELIVGMTPEVAKGAGFVQINIPDSPVVLWADNEG